MEYLYIYLAISVINAFFILLFNNSKLFEKYCNAPGNTFVATISLVTPVLVAILLLFFGTNGWSFEESLGWCYAVAIGGYAINYVLYIVVPKVIHLLSKSKK